MSRKLMYLVLVLAAMCLSASLTFAQETALTGQLTEEDLQALNDGQAEIFTHNGRVTFVSGTCTADPILSEADAEAVVNSMIGLLGGDSRTHFEQWRTLSDSQNNTYYVFQQMYANTTVLGGAVKVITDPQGNMIGLSSSIETELPEEEESEGISAEEAEALVMQHMAETEQQEVDLIGEFTSKMILPISLSIDIEDEGYSRFVWVVYTDNPQSRVSSAVDLPYLAHYVTMDGEYLYALETIIPGDRAGEAGFDSSYIFEFMEPVDYTGYVDLSDGSEMELTVTVMRDKRTGMYYLGNIERQIVVADCWEFLYNDGNVVLDWSPDNLEWDQVGLISLYNYCKAWDYYSEIGWIGGDGRGTPILILNDICDEKHNRIDNAVFIGNYLGWSIFGASKANDFVQGLDVIAHEFTHCVTHSVMTYNSYQNDYGAINEAISDIQGQICDLMNGNTQDTEWIIGDKLKTKIRSMSNPGDYGQPAFSWDIHYRPSVLIPTTMNDGGGVHSNSSLLNNIAYRLVNDGGMSLEEARAYWFAVDCTMVPGTDYQQLRELLPWVLKTLGMEQYDTALQAAIDAVRLGDDTMPDFFDDDRALLTLTLPDNENFTDGNWAMNILLIDINGVIGKATEIFSALTAKDYSSFPPEIRDLFTEMDRKSQEQADLWNSMSFLEKLEYALDQALESGEPEAAMNDDELESLIAWIRKELSVYLYYGMGAAGSDNLTIQMVTRPGRTVPFLMHLVFEDTSPIPKQEINAIFFNGKWYVIGKLMTVDPEKLQESSPFTENGITEELVNYILENIGNVKSVDDFLDLVTVNVKGGSITELPNTGLEDLVLPEMEEDTGEDAETPAELPEPGKKSRPKR